MKRTKLSILNFQFSISFALAVVMLLGACANQERYYTLTGELPDSSYNGMTVYLADFDNASKIDSTTVDGNRVTFRGIAPDTTLFVQLVIG